MRKNTTQSNHILISLSWLFSLKAYVCLVSGSKIWTLRITHASSVILSLLRIIYYVQINLSDVVLCDCFAVYASYSYSISIQRLFSLISCKIEIKTVLNFLKCHKTKQKIYFIIASLTLNLAPNQSLFPGSTHKMHITFYGSIKCMCPSSVCAW